MVDEEKLKKYKSNQVDEEALKLKLEMMEDDDWYGGDVDQGIVDEDADDEESDWDDD